MTNKVIAIQGDELSKLNLKTDTTIYLANEIQSKYRIFYYLPQNLSVIKNRVFAEGNYIKINYLKNKISKVSKKIKINLSLTRYILIRQDPPFNLNYISTTLILEILSQKVKIINDPKAIRNVSEKFYSLNFSKFMPDTIFSNNIIDINKFFLKYKKIIIKPIHGHGGNDIHFLNGKFNTKLVKKFLKKHGYIMCQKYLEKITFGDKRVFIINGKICGAISRVPKPGSFLSNMGKGAVPKLIKLNAREIKICKVIAKKLKKDNIFFSGIDFIDGKLNGDINVTSPTGLKTFHDLSKINLAKVFWKELKA